MTFIPHKQATTERELFINEGDVVDPVLGSQNRGAQSTVNLERLKLGVPKVRYTDRSGNDFIMTVDVYKTAGAPMELHMYCPRCSRKGSMHTLRIPEEKKQMTYDPKDFTDRGGRLNVERFMCTFELDSTRGVSAVSSANLCAWTVEIVDNVAREA